MNEQLIAKVEQLLSLDNTAFFNALSKRERTSNKNANEHLLHTIMHYADKETKLAILRRIDTLTTSQKLKILFDSSETDLSKRHSNFLDLLPEDDADACHELLLVYKSIPANLRFPTYQTESSIFSLDRFSGVINFFLRNKHVHAGLIMIAMLGEHSTDELNELIFRLENDEYNLSHAIIKNQSAMVVTKFLQLLKDKKFSEDSLNILMTETDPDSKSAQTFLETALTRVDDQQIAREVINFVYSFPSLWQLLTKVSIIDPESPMHMAANAGNTGAVTAFLEKENSDKEHKTKISSKTMLELAYANNHLGTSLVFEALPIYQAILGGHDAVDIDSLLEKIPAILDTRWQDGKTLLHLAAEKGRIDIVNALLKKGANPQALDQKKQTALDCAFNSNQTQIVTALVQADKTKPETIKNTLNGIRLSGNREAFKEALCSIDKPLTTVFEQYASRTHDAAIAHLIATAKLVNTNQNDALIPIVSDFIASHLKQTNDNAKLQLVSLIFSLDVSHFEKVAQPSEKLAAVLSFGLQQPAIYTQLSVAQFNAYFNIIEQSRKTQEKPLAEIFESYLLSEHLELIPVEIIEYLSPQVSSNWLKSNYALTHNPIFLALMLLKSSESDELFNQLWLELNKPAITDKELVIILNLIKDPAIKNRLNEKLTTPDSAFSARLATLFIDYKSTVSLLHGSFLRQKFISFAIDFNPAAPAAYEQLLSVCDSEETQDILGALQHFFTPQLAHHDHFSVQNNASLTPDFSQWLYSRSLQAPRQQLMVLWAAANQKAGEIRKLADSTENEDHAVLLLELATQLDKVSSKLYLTYSTLNMPVWNESLQAETAKLSALLNNSHLDFNPDLISELTDLATEIEKRCQRSDEYINQISQNTDVLHRLNPDLAQVTHLLTKPKTDINSSNINQSLNQKLINPAHQLSRHLVRAALSQLDNIAMFPQFSNWLLQLSSVSNTSDFYDYLSAFMQKHSPAMVQSFQEEVEQRLDLYSQNLLILCDLKQLLLQETITPAQLITALFNYDKEQLILFRHHCEQASSHSILPLLDNIIAAKQSAIPSPFLTSPRFLSTIKDISPWVQQIDNQLSHYSNHISSLNLICRGLYHEQESKARLLALANSIDNGDGKADHSSCIHILRSYQQPLSENKLDEDDKRTLINITHGLINHKTPEMIQQLLSALPDELMNHFSDLSMEGLASVDKAYAANCRQLLTLICQYHESSTDAKQINQIKRKLGAQDLHLLKDKQLKDIARDILKGHEGEDLLDQTINGIWIQRLLTSPRFIAACPPEIIQILFDRYRMISLILKQDEFNRLTVATRSKMSFFDQHQHNFSSENKELLQKHLLAKRQRLLEFRADDSVRALSIQLEENCFELKQTKDKTTAEAALNHLYIHHANNLKGFRHDFLSRLTNYVWDAVTDNKGDLQILESNLAHWINTYLPSYKHNFTQKELATKSAVFLYNQKGEKIAFVNDAGKVMAFHNDKPYPALSIKNEEGKQLYPVNYSFYEEKGHKLAGTLLESGSLERDNLFQKRTSAMLLAKVPIADLEKTEAAISLLIRDVLGENEVETLFVNASEQNSHWLQDKLSKELTEYANDLGDTSVKAIVQHQEPASLFMMLGEIKQKNNARKLYEVILKDNNLRTQLFSEKYQAQFHKFLKNQDAVQLFADFLAQDNETAVYLSGLSAFADFAKVENNLLLVNALNQLRQSPSISDAHYDKILTKLIDSEEACKILWHQYLGADVHDSVQSVNKKNQDLSSRLTKLFYKHHCQDTLNHITEQSSWTESYQYRLFLLLLSKQRDQLFSNIEYRYSEKQAWGQTELSQMSLFVTRHLNESANIDENHHVGNKLFYDLVYRTANFGNPQLFYTQDKSNSETPLKFNGEVAQKTIKRSMLQNVVAKNHLLSESAKKVSGAWKAVKLWLNDEKISDEQEKIVEQLKAEKAIVDWRSVCDSTWEQGEFNQGMPLITAYLFNYSGTKKDLEILLKDYLELALQKPDMIHALTTVIDKLPQRHVSACLFNQLEAFYTANPDRLNAKTFSQMANYFSQHHPHNQSPKKELMLVQHFGLQKKYDLVKHCCKLLCDEPFKLARRDQKLVGKIKIETEVENGLQAKLGKWYFRLLKFFKRYFNYDDKEKSDIILFCDDQTPYINKVTTPDLIESNIKSGQVIHHELKMHKKIQSLKKRVKPFFDEVEQKKKLPKLIDVVLEPVMSETDVKSAVSGAGKSRCSFYAHKEQTKELQESPRLAVECN